MNKLILKNLRLYIEYYLPKYIGNFSVSNMNGNLYFGVSDFGIIEGIPYNGNITE